MPLLLLPLKVLLFNVEEERQALVENVRGALKENGLSFQEWELREQELMRAAVTRQQRGHLLETFFRHLFSQVCTWDQIWCVHTCVHVHLWWHPFLHEAMGMIIQISSLELSAEKSVPVEIKSAGFYVTGVLGQRSALEVWG